MLLGVPRHEDRRARSSRRSPSAILSHQTKPKPRSQVDVRECLRLPGATFAEKCKQQASGDVQVVKREKRAAKGAHHKKEARCAWPWHGAWRDGGVRVQRDSRWRRPALGALLILAPLRDSRHQGLGPPPIGHYAQWEEALP